MSRLRKLGLAIVLAAASLTLGACGGSGGSNPIAEVFETVFKSAALDEKTTMSETDAVRLAKQATFGPTKPLVDHIVAVGLEGWLNEQFAASGSTYADLATRTVARNYCNQFTGAAATACNRDYMSATPMQMRFYSNAMQQPDQLRQRVAFALSQILVASDVEVRSVAGLAALNQMFLDNAFGNYRNILINTTQNPYMGDYLDMANSSRTAPNENYARELMQLFSMGVNKLNPDGTEQTDSTGAAIPTYTAADVKEVARAFTGWTYVRLNGAPINDNNQINFAAPMMTNPAIYDSTAKNFLGTSVPAGAGPPQSFLTVIDAVFNNASTAPYISKQLIQQLVMSNPSPAYVSRVTTAFADNGSGVRGDLRAVVRAILTDPEARDTQPTPAGGKVKEPVLLATSIGRLIGFSSDGYAFTTGDVAMGQAPFRSPSVFNFYPPGYPLPQGGGLLSPPSKLITTATVLARHNLVYDWTVSGEQTRGEFAVQTAIPGATGTQVDWSSWEVLRDPNVLLDRVNLLMLNNSMNPTQRAALLTAVNAITATDPLLQAKRRAQMALYVVGTSPAFQTDR